MMLTKEMLKEFVEGAKAEKVKDFTFKLIDQLNQAQLNTIEQGFKVSLHWQGADCTGPAKPARTPVIEPQAQTLAPRRGRPPKIQDAMIPDPPSDEEEGDDAEVADEEDDLDSAEDLFKNIDKTLAGTKPRQTVDETEREFERVMGNARRMR